MKGNASSADWSEFETFRLAYAREVMYSKNPSEILLSDPGDYPFVDRVVSEKVEKRFRVFGPVAELFNDAKRRHLIELTRAQQDFSEMLSGLSEAAKTRRRAFHAFHDELRANELRTFGDGSTDEWNESVQSDEAACAAILRSLGQSLGDKIAWKIHSSQEGAILRIHIDDDFNLLLVPKIEADWSARPNGIIYWHFHLMDGPDTAPLDPNVVWIPWALPGRFAVYENFSNCNEYQTATSAWQFATRFLIEYLCRRSNGRVELTG
ncbi:MAG TPA: hypothetical protein VMF52_06525 [Steroidobacteraceae bacterium]|nr:hypothetical protein [Steroidobacteraceae bacterium]